MKPIRLLWLVLIVVLGWSAWWGWGAWNAKRGLTAWLEERRAAGWQAEWGEITVAGYPTRIDRTITDVVLANTEAGWVWTAPFLQILGLNYQKDHVVLVWPDRMGLQTPYEQIEIAGEELRGSVTFAPGPAREVDEAVVVLRGLNLSSDAGWTSRVEEARLAIRPDAADAQMQQVGLEIVGLKPRSPLLERLADMGLVPPTVERLNADLGVRFDAPWDRAALEGARPQPQEIDIREIGARWGRLDLRIAGEVVLDAQGEVSGEVLVKATNWREMIALLRESGLVAPALVDALDSALQLLGSLAGRPDTLDIPLTFQNGTTRIGLLPVGPAPVIRLP